MLNMSVTISGIFVAALIWFFRESDVTVAPENIQNFVETAGLLASALVVWFGRWRQGDIKWWGGRRRA